MNLVLLPDGTPDEVTARRREAVDAGTLAAAARIVLDVKQGGFGALRAMAERHDSLKTGEPLIHEREALVAAVDRVAPETRALLERVADRIRRFAAAQRSCLDELEIEVAEGAMGHRVVPLARAGCYAPGGRYPYPSSVLMTAVVARVAGVREVWVASPKPTDVTLAAAAIAGADALVAAGGAHAVAAFAYGAGMVPACDAVVGPGNRWVTAGKQLVAGVVRIDSLAGPSELLVIADATADAASIAADLIAQAEHDPDAVTVLLTPEADLAHRVRVELAAQLAGLPTAETARASLSRGRAVRVAHLDEAIEISEAIGPEHLELVVSDPDAIAPRLSTYGTLFDGHGAAEVFGDYGAGPNHVLPTGGTARNFSGLSVLNFLRMPTHLRMRKGSPPAAMIDDAAALARLEGLEGHARAAEQRRGKP